MGLPRPVSQGSLLEGVAALVDALDGGGGGWIEIGSTGAPAFQNGWSNTGGVETAAFYKDPFGVVRIKGQVSSPAGAGTGNATVCFTLPAGFLPPLGIRRAAIGFSAAEGLGRVDVAANGTVTAVLSGVVANAVVVTFTIGCEFRTI